MLLLVNPTGFEVANIIMTFAVALCLALIVCANGSGVDSAHMQCESDSQCPDNYFCYLESQTCTRCVECAAYLRKTSWRACPKTPSDCGACIPGFEEDILHEGKVREMCVPSTTATSLSQRIVPTQSAERYLWVTAILVLLLPVVFYTFFKKRWQRERGMIHQSLAHEDPPPYQSIELTTLSNNSVERLSEADLKMEVQQDKDSLVQAVPFRNSDYQVEPDFLAFENSNPSEEHNIGAETADDSHSQAVGGTVEVVDIHDDNTMPSNWTPNGNEEDGDQQLMTFGTPEPESEDDDEVAPVTKKRRYSGEEEPEGCNSTQSFNINLIINNNVSIIKQS